MTIRQLSRRTNLREPRAGSVEQRWNGLRDTYTDDHVKRPGALHVCPKVIYCSAISLE